MNYYQFHIGDYAGHTRHLSLLEDLAYRRLLDAYYLAERPFNGCSTDVARLIGMRDHLDAVEYVLQTFFEQTEDGWRNKRADEEIDHYLSKKKQASNAGRASAERRLNGRSTPVEEIATDVQPTNNQEPITNNHKKRESAQKRATRKAPEAFDLNDDMREWAVEHAPAVDVDLATAKFRDHTFRTAITDWPAAWRNWLRKEQEFATERRPVSGVRQVPRESFRERDERMAAEKWARITGQAIDDGRTIDVAPAFPALESEP